MFLSTVNEILSTTTRNFTGKIVDKIGDAWIQSNWFTFLSITHNPSFYTVYEISCLSCFPFWSYSVFDKVSKIKLSGLNPTSFTELSAGFQQYKLLPQKYTNRKKFFWVNDQHGKGKSIDVFKFNEISIVGDS